MISTYLWRVISIANFVICYLLFRYIKKLHLLIFISQEKKHCIVNFQRRVEDIIGSWWVLWNHKGLVKKQNRKQLTTLFEFTQILGETSELKPQKWAVCKISEIISRLSALDMFKKQHFSWIHIRGGHNVIF